MSTDKNQKWASKRPVIKGTTYGRLIWLVEQFAARRNEPVLFFGETGSGKEVFAELIAFLSPRQKEKRAVNCSAFPEGLLDSEIFGHVKGAFTGATRAKRGLLEICSDGVLFLDEIGASSQSFQAKILRIAATIPQRYTPVGGEIEKVTDVLFIAATNDLKSVRDDLRLRFHLLPVPPLQKHDIPELAEYILGKPIRKNILKELITLDYPGNIRGLEKECKRKLVENGDAIFSKNIKDRTTKPPGTKLFDYDRFEREFNLWKKYILPIVEKFELGFEYRYFPATEPGLIDQYGEFSIEQMATMIEELGVFARDEVLLRRFSDGLMRYFDDRALNFLLEGIDSLISSRRAGTTVFVSIAGKNEASQKAEIESPIKGEPPTPPDGPEPPDVRHLFEESPKEARKQFNVGYWKYQMQKFGNIDAIASGLNQNPETVRTAITRIRSSEKKSRLP